MRGGRESERGERERSFVFVDELRKRERERARQSERERGAEREREAERKTEREGGSEKFCVCLRFSLFAQCALIHFIYIYKIIIVCNHYTYM